jgi:type I restriction enzyme S subunit
MTEPAAFGAFMAIFRSRVNKFLYHFICSPLFRRMIDEVNTTTINQITQNNLRSTLAPLPPLAEQKRIVAKVDELMALCDRLEAQQQERETRHAALARASLARFADAPTPANLQFLFHPSYAIPPSDLRKSILTLAVQGKLVPQDPNDEPAEELAAEFARLKAQLLAARRIRNQKVLDCPSDDDFPFEIPASWEWVRLGHAATLLGGYAYESGAYVPSSSNQIIRLGNVKSDALLLDQKPACIPDALAEQTAEHAILEGDILVTMTGTKAKRDYAFTLAVKRADLGGRRLFLNQRVGAIRPFQRELVPLINVFLKSDQLLDLIFATSTGTANQANIGTSSILDLPFPIPPLAEQRRIVAKVEQLMALVDALETQLAASRDKGEKLLEAVVKELTAV